MKHYKLDWHANLVSCHKNNYIILYNWSVICCAKNGVQMVHCPVYFSDLHYYDFKSQIHFVCWHPFNAFHFTSLQNASTLRKFYQAVQSFFVCISSLTCLLSFCNTKNTFILFLDIECHICKTFYIHRLREVKKSRGICRDLQNRIRERPSQAGRRWQQPENFWSSGLPDVELLATSYSNKENQTHSLRL